MTWTLLLLGILSAGPTWAQQRGQTRVDAPLDSADVISWRALSFEDFRGDHPPGAFATTSGAMRPVAVTCAYLVASPEARIYPLPVSDAPPDSAYVARVEDLSFHALMSRSCSWWNPNSRVSPAYVLQHEQIHFDIFEVAARRLNQELPGLLATMDVRGGSVQSVVAGAQRVVQEALNQALEETARQNHSFDLQTSFGFELQRQNGWRRRLDRDLKDLQPFVAPVEQITPKALGE